MPDDARPAHRHPRAVTLVALGGALGAVARFGVAEALPHAYGDVAWATFVVNIAGAFVLGCLLEALTRSGPDTGARRSVRLVLGTGFCGAFTTYSTFAHDIVTLDRGFGVGVGWAALHVTCGLVAAAFGAVVGAAATSRRRA
ncbi:fluoride efflux transporter FluC [Dermacoccus barathri]|uniref:fluoride efflux transporter FluC n=1 Tax=Dermacoccus barathri TaxID=322601 RepID=UPI0018792258|nr:CrcB family protein [Dermacoccus barathri]MBE7370387.1 CrcB family protein [Dermacoccus barathri]